MGARGGVVLEDGPAVGRYSVRRAPYFLRAVVNRATGARDLLDQLEDQPMPGEAVHVYEAIGHLFDPDLLARTGTFLCPRPGASGTYRHRADVDGEQLREAAAWRAWARAQPVDRDLFDGATLELIPAGEVR